MEQEFELVGEPFAGEWTGRGRPPHQSTPEKRNKVAMLLAFGWSDERIARAMRISAPTLRKSYFLKVGKKDRIGKALAIRESARERLDAAFKFRVWTKAQEGDVSAMRLMAQIIEREITLLPPAGTTLDSEDEAIERLGKKDQAQRAAQQTSIADWVASETRN